MSPLVRYSSLMVSFVLVGCATATVRQQDLDAWVGMPVEALESHSFFVTLPVYRSKTDSGVEIWNYSNTRDVASCYGYGGVGSCISSKSGCHNLFYIRDGVVQEYKPSGNCFTDESVQPEERSKELIKR